ncbi:MAG: sulfotransferase [Cyanothece sp. SIO2G6]|nr:sulfotransferase [Cyanothece sp. SIO2G6]
MSETPLSSSLIFSTHRVGGDSAPPVIVVGLPRSGSSFLAHLLSTLEGWYLFDDLYPYQKAQACGASGILSSQQLAKFVEALAWATRARIKWERNFSAPQMTWEDVDKMEAAVRQVFEVEGGKWHEVLQEWMMRLAQHHNCTRWGYKTPQDFMHMEKLTRLFPGVKFVFIMRDPRKVMRSLKNLPNEKGGDGDRKQYHPIAYSLYWKMAYERVQTFIDSGLAPVHIIRFEELVTEPDLQAQTLAQFLGTTVSGPTEVKQGNSSFKSQQQIEMTDTECWICEKLAGATMVKAGYSLSQIRPRFRDIPELLRISTQFVWFQLHRATTDPEKRSSILAVATSFFRRTTPQTPKIEET